MNLDLRFYEFKSQILFWNMDSERNKFLRHAAKDIDFGFSEYATVSITGFTALKKNNLPDRRAKYIQMNTSGMLVSQMGQYSHRLSFVKNIDWNIDVKVKML